MRIIDSELKALPSPLLQGRMASIQLRHETVRRGKGWGTVRHNEYGSAVPLG